MRLSNSNVSIDEIYSDTKFCTSLKKPCFLAFEIFTYHPNLSPLHAKFSFNLYINHRLASVTYTFCRSTSIFSSQHIIQFMKSPYAWSYKYLSIFRQARSWSFPYTVTLSYTPSRFNFRFIIQSSINFLFFTSSLIRFTWSQKHSSIHMTVQVRFLLQIAFWLASTGILRFIPHFLLKGWSTHQYDCSLTFSMLTAINTHSCVLPNHKSNPIFRSIACPWHRMLKNSKESAHLHFESLENILSFWKWTVGSDQIEQLRCTGFSLWELQRLLLSDHILGPKAGPCICWDHVNSHSNAITRNTAVHLCHGTHSLLSCSLIRFQTSTVQELIHSKNRGILEVNYFILLKK